MENMPIQELAQKGQEYLAEAVLSVLSIERERGDGCLGAAEIGRQTGIFGDRGVVNIMNDAIVTGILVYLHDEGKVTRCTQKGKSVGGWEITDDEFERRRAGT